MKKSPMVVKVPSSEKLPDEPIGFDNLDNINKLHLEMLENPARVEPHVVGQPLSPSELNVAHSIQTPIPTPPSPASPVSTTPTMPIIPVSLSPPPPPPSDATTATTAHVSPTFDVNKFVVPDEDNSDDDNSDGDHGATANNSEQASPTGWTLPPHLQSRAYIHGHRSSRYHDSYRQRYGSVDFNSDAEYDEEDEPSPTQRRTPPPPVGQGDDQQRTKAQVMLLKLNDLKARADLRDDMAHMPDLTLETDPKTIETAYYHTVHKLKTRSQAAWYKQVLFAVCYVLEMVLGSIVGLDMQGFAIEQWKQINKYDDLLIELGEKYMSESAVRFPVEARLAGVLLFNAALYALSRGSGPVQLVGRFLGMFNSSESSRSRKENHVPSNRMKEPMKLRKKSAT